MGWALNQIKEKHHTSNEAHANAVAGPVGNIEIVQADHVPTLRSETSHVLCHWQLFDDVHFLSYALHKLSNDVRVDSNDVPTAISTPGSASKEAEKKLEKEFKEKVSTSFS